MYGRWIPEILRTVEALQTTDRTGMSIPANWMPGQPLIQPSPQTFSQLQERVKEIEKDRNGFSWYLSFANDTERGEKRKENIKEEDKTKKD